jgi:hypothetical protein
VGDDEGIGAAQAGQRLAQHAARQHVLKAEGFAGIDQDDIQITPHGPVLKAVVEQEKIDSRIIPQGGLCGGRAIRIGYKPHRICTVRIQCLRKHELLIAQLARRFVAAGKDADVPAGIAELPGNELHEWRFAGSSGRDVSDTDDRAAKPVGLPEATVEKMISQSQGGCIERFGDCRRQP